MNRGRKQKSRDYTSSYATVYVHWLVGVGEERRKTKQRTEHAEQENSTVEGRVWLWDAFIAAQRNVGRNACTQQRVPAAHLPSLLASRSGPKRPEHKSRIPTVSERPTHPQCAASTQACDSEEGAAKGGG